LLARLDFSLLQQALGNLLLNAPPTPARTPLKFVPLRPPMRSHCPSVTPGGIAEDLLRAFSTSSPVCRRAYGRSGLGLAIVKGFVEAHNGTVIAPTVPVAARCLR